ncbi:hypothetical protein HN588_11915 [Candidatus Bathyarchaeota archaeon]|nr:hypothetical protein [Candidatus Bathyarchaeota archaeon]
MRDKPRIGVIGQGFVGGSLSQIFAERGFEVYTYDKAGVTIPGTDPRDSLEEMVGCVAEKNTYPIVFVCLPTPMRKTGEADLTIVEGVLDQLASLCSRTYSTPITAVVKSTIPPGSTEKWNIKYDQTNLSVVFNPEFLTEANAVNDMRDQNRIVVGGPRPASTAVKNLFRQAFPQVKIIKTSSTIAEMVKYFTNGLLATKVSFANEVFQICEGLGIDYDKVLEYSLHDTRIGKTHLSVPGPDGSFGFGGHCVKGDRLVKVDDGLSGPWSPIKDVRTTAEVHASYKSPGSIVMEGYLGSYDSTLSSRGSKAVEDVECREYSGPMIEFVFDSHGKERTFECTPEHLLPVKRSGEMSIVMAKDISMDDELYISDEFFDAGA